jgi:hypothetical protein
VAQAMRWGGSGTAEISRPEAAGGARSRMRPEGWERRRQPNTHPEHHGKQKEEEAVAWGRKRGGR